ncbi:hypothetical protein GGS23DRAFT_611236 [Durotheca rogersii]|uniref:uncharacterized protein n=1 Tax=Durotheca rogersii TaxID=419775 RepID=UPI00221F8724|nr:uncharacterized protein GGS23DRAFT_611236 [Durotheca rogersii]KAI5862029.1 hypothetical protein GGS23DRAFT_611236 [Durotheca rogersii]
MTLQRPPRQRRSSSIGQRDASACRLQSNSSTDAQRGVIQKPRRRTGAKSRSGKGQRRNARVKIAKELEKRVEGMGPEAALLQQRELLGLPANPPNVAAVRVDAGTPPAKAKRRGRRNTRDKERYMDDFLLSDEEEGGGAHREDEGGDRLQRADRWLPDVEHRRRPSEKPKNIPQSLWMSYCLMDDYIYRYSLSDDEVRALPLMDDIYNFQNGGPQPITPAGFQWDKNGTLVPVQDSGRC